MTLFIPCTAVAGATQGTPWYLIVLLVGSIVFAVLSGITGLVYVRKYLKTGIIVKSDPENNYARLHVTNKGAKATFKATAQIVENNQLIGSSWPVRWRGSLREGQEIDKDGDHILDIASIGVVHLGWRVISSDEVDQNEASITFFTPELSISGGKTSDSFNAPKIDSMIMHIKITSDPPQKKTYEKKWVLIPNEGDGKPVSLSLILREANEN